MLAEAMVRLQRPGKPQRYAMDPVHRQAIENYLALMTRGYGLPQAHRQATPVIDQRLGEVDAPLFHRLMAGLFQGDESVPGATLDLLRDRDIEPGTVHDIGNQMEYPQGHQMTPDDHFDDLLTRLVQAHHHLTGGLDVRGMFHPERMRQRQIVDIGRGLIPPDLDMGNQALVDNHSQQHQALLRTLTSRLARLQNPEHFQSASLYNDLVMNNRPETLPRLYDFADRHASNINNAGSTLRQAGNVRDATGNATRNVFLRLTGQLPLDGNNG
jgi:hypothetical protein